MDDFDMATDSPKMGLEKILRGLSYNDDERSEWGKTKNQTF